MKNKLALSLGALALAGGLTYTVSQAQAFGFGNGEGNGNQQDMAADLANKLGKSEEEVQTAFDSLREDHRQQAESAFEERLTTAVDNGEITEDQKQLILAKHEELQAQFDAEQQQRSAHRQELQDWADENGIDMSFLGGGMGYGREGGKGMGMGRMGR